MNQRPLENSEILAYVKNKQTSLECTFEEFQNHPFISSSSVRHHHSKAPALVSFPSSALWKIGKAFSYCFRETYFSVTQRIYNDNNKKINHKDQDPKGNSSLNSRSSLSFHKQTASESSPKALPDWAGGVGLILQIGC